MKQVAPFGKGDSGKTKSPAAGGASPVSAATVLTDSKKDTPSNSQKKDSQESINKPLQLQPIPASQSVQSNGTPRTPQTPGTPAIATAASWDGLNGKNPSTAQALPKDFVFAQPLALPPRDGPRRDN